MQSGSDLKKLKLACQTCRKRRRKCDLQVPCVNCQKFGVECLPVDQDLRKKRYSAQYVQSLHAHISQLEAYITQLKSAENEEERKSVLASIKFNVLKDAEGLSPAVSLTPPYLAQVADAEGAELARVGRVGGEALHKKKQVSSSIYSSDSLMIQKRPQPAGVGDALDPVPKLKNLSRSPLILRSLSLFFKWLYPGPFTFIHRETFLSAFFGDAETKTYYCSEELVFAIAALGSRLSQKGSDLFAKTAEYYNISKTKVLSKVFQLDSVPCTGMSSSSSKLAVVQTLLCLAFYDMGNGENPLAWYESGLAFRIAHEIGLHLNPEAWDDVYADKLSHLDIEVRSRIYWGCYIADHLIAVLFGRSYTLRLSNSTIPETDELPNIDTGIEDYQYEPGVSLYMAKPLKKLIVLSRITEVFASKLFVQDGTMAHRKEYLRKFNLEFYNWRITMPAEFRWTKNSIKDFDNNPTVSYLWYHYYIILLSYNKPFMEELEQSRLIVEETVEEIHILLVNYKNKFITFEKCSIYMVYSAILAIQCLRSGSIKKKNLADFMDFLGSDTLPYELARKLFDSEMTSAEGVELLGTLANGNDFAFEYNFDFTLLNEIDTLIGGTHNGFT
ncbi:AGR061Cp [Eremothecium gossypii ATCC 10895]|uniref:AGR061Cp n=1 Tax=Eremothecium gossypii (strain ATCC 10895 / CBS 109.51 / FGSC 9923 / NRRL Y-1056) TaxID=284811 RepID=Q74ZZ6_EREGS|nr:AGR061Cp [Eremothecium gossypii ATCC 10895]AAS54550.1 AGR061Cp [Eremothecium gossypii ATCC 10895]